MSQISQADLAKMSKEDLAKLVTELAAKNTRKVSFKVSAKQGLSVYGIHSRFPVTLYASQWETLLAHADAIKKFIADNSANLARKPV